MKNTLLSLFTLFSAVVYTQSAYLYYLGLGNQEILRMDTTGQTEIMRKGYLSGISSMFFDRHEEKIYWITANTEFTDCSNGHLYSANRDGTEIESIFQSELFAAQTNNFKIPFFVDSPNEKVYFLANNLLMQLDYSSMELTQLGDDAYKGSFCFDQANQLIYYTSFYEVNRYDLASNSTSTVFNLLYPGVIAIDTVANHLYCSHFVMEDGSTTLNQFNLSGNILNNIATGTDGIESLLIDQEGQYLYRTERQVVYRTALNGGNEEIILTEGDNNKLNLTFDPTQRDLYWGIPNWGDIKKTDPDNVVPQVVVEPNVGRIPHMLHDKDNERIYWAESLGKISYSDYDFTEIHTIQLDQPISPAEIALDANQEVIYWADFQDNQIHKANISDGEVTLWSNEEADIFATFITNLQLDTETSEIFWYDHENSAIKKSALAAYVPTVLYSTPSLERGFTLDKVQKKVLWIEYEGNIAVIKSMNYDGTNIEQIPQDEPLLSSFRSVNVEGSQMVLTKSASSSSIYLSNDSGNNFYEWWGIPCQPMTLFMLGNFFIPTLVKQEELLVANGFSFFPNPANDYLHIRFNGDYLPEPLLNLNLYNSLGQLVCRYQFNSSNPLIDISDVSSGLYYLQIQSPAGKRYLSEKVVISSH